jgi:hypothetical protein
MVDSKHQVVVHAEAAGEPEPQLLAPMVAETRENFKKIGKEEDIFKKTKLSGDTGFHSEKNMEMLIEEGIDAYVADNKFRHRDLRYSTADRHKERFNKEVAKRFDRAIIFQPRDFTVSPDKSFCISQPASGCTKAAMRSTMASTPSSTMGPNGTASPAPNEQSA